MGAQIEVHFQLSLYVKRGARVRERKIGRKREREWAETWKKATSDTSSKK
jgi:hypothetical protein